MVEPTQEQTPAEEEVQAAESIETTEASEEIEEAPALEAAEETPMEEEEVEEIPEKEEVPEVKEAPVKPGKHIMSKTIKHGGKMYEKGEAYKLSKQMVKMMTELDALARDDGEIEVPSEEDPSKTKRVKLKKGEYLLKGGVKYKGKLYKAGVHKLSDKMAQVIRSAGVID